MIPSTRDTGAFVDAVNARMGQSAAQHRLAQSSQENTDLHRKHAGELVENDRIVTEVNERNAKLAKENQTYKELLARPLQEILDENANYKKAYEEQQAIIAMWLARQRAMKKVAVDFAKKAGVNVSEVAQQADNNVQKILQGDNLGAVVEPVTMEYFEKHKIAIVQQLKR